MNLEQEFARAWKAGVVRVLLYLVERSPYCFKCTVQQPHGKRIKEVRGNGLTEAEALKAALDKLEDLQETKGQKVGQ